MSRLARALALSGLYLGGALLAVSGLVAYLDAHGLYRLVGAGVVLAAGAAALAGRYVDDDNGQLSRAGHTAAAGRLAGLWGSVFLLGGAVWLAAASGGERAYGTSYVERLADPEP